MINTSMNIFESHKNLSWMSLLILVAFFVVGLFIGQFLGVVISLLISGSDLDGLLGLVSQPFTEDKRIPLMVIQGFGAFGGFILGAALYMKIVERTSPFVLLSNKSINVWVVLLAIFIVMSFMMVNSFFIEWNMNIVFPSFMSGFESWARNKETELQAITDFLTSFSSSTEFFIAIIVIAILPAFGEEYLFRGIIQNKLSLYLKNAHIGIWLTAILFSGFHLQFFGFVPRMFLGVLFGYLYYWSGNLWVPIIAHFINNVFTLTMLYLYQIGMTGFDIEEQESLPWHYLILFMILTGFLLYYFKRNTASVKTGYE